LRSIADRNTRALATESGQSVRNAPGADDGFFVRGVCARLGRGHETRAHPTSGGTRGDGGGETAPVGDATAGHDRNVDGVENLAQQRPQAAIAVHAPAALGAPRHDQVAARVGRGSRLVDRADLPARQCATGVHPLHQRRIDVPVVEVHVAAAGCGHVEDVGVEERNQHVEAEGPLDLPAERVERLGHDRSRGPRHADHSHAPGADHGPHELGRAHRAHGRELNGNLAADQVGERRAHLPPSTGPVDADIFVHADRRVRASGGRGRPSRYRRCTPSVRH
jgi:hypothetical protein